MFENIGKKIKLTLIISLLCGTLILLLTSCSGGSKPSKNQILKDLKESFAEKYESYYEVMDIKSFGVELSESGEKEYTANLNITAKSNSGYAEIYWKADVKYLKYDQGWRMEECSWEYGSHKVVKYPNKKEITDIVCSIKGNNAKVESFDILRDEEQIICRVNDEIEWSKYGSGKVVTDLTLDYSRLDDGWGKYSDKYVSDEFSLNNSLAKQYTIQEGMWQYVGNYGVYAKLPSSYAKDGYITISNVSDTGLDIICKSSKLNVSKIHFDVEGIVVYDDTIRVNFSEKNNVTFNGGSTGIANLYINLNRFRSNGDIEIHLSFGNKYIPDIAAYANTSNE